MRRKFFGTHRSIHSRIHALPLDYLPISNSEYPPSIRASLGTLHYFRSHLSIPSVLRMVIGSRCHELVSILLQGYSAVITDDGTVLLDAHRHSCSSLCLISTVCPGSSAHTEGLSYFFANSSRDLLHTALYSGQVILPISFNVSSVSGSPSHLNPFDSIHTLTV